MTWPARTARLLIRRVTADDAAAVWRYRRLPEVFDWITTAPGDEHAFTAYFEDPHRLAVTLAVEHEGVVIGDLYLHIEDPWAHTVSDSLHRSGNWLDGYGYALLAEEWRAGS